MKKDDLLKERVEIVLFLLSCEKPKNIKEISEAIYGSSEEKNCKKIIRQLNFLEEHNKNIFQYINVSKVDKVLHYNIKIDKIEINNNKWYSILTSFIYKMIDTSIKEKIREKNEETIESAIKNGYHLIFDKNSNGKFDIIPIYYFKEFNRIINYPRISMDDKDESINAIIVDDTMSEIKTGKKITNDKYMNFKLEKINNYNDYELVRQFELKNEFDKIEFKLDSFNSYNVNGKMNNIIIEMKKEIISNFTNKFPISKNHYLISEEMNNDHGIIKMKLINKNVRKVISFLYTQNDKMIKLFINDKLFEFNN